MTEATDLTITWHRNLEEYFASTGEKANCLSWCHKRAEELYSKRRTYIDLPVITLSAVTGFLSVGSSTMFEGQERSASIGLGCISLLVSVLNVMGTYFGWSKRSEGHRISSIQYSRLYRSLMVELGLPREERQAPTILLKHVRDQYDRLQEISPLLPPEIIKVFNDKFHSEKEISKPEELNGLEKITIYPVERTNDGHSNLTIQTPQATRLSDLLRRNGSFSETSGDFNGHSSGGSIEEGRKSGGGQSILTLRQGHEANHTNA